ncbi:MAG: LamG domain-containing protein [Candidatus Micrarchaeota archaeon]|nr:LamG domain-containing protein [Candidatus Micrarchaeota archaeon]
MATSRPRTMLQSAMEYLMTYGWAILAIAIVMVSLYSLGIFNLGNLQPTAAPGSCQVVRTAAQTSLAGQCSNLIPKYVGQFNGASSYITMGATGMPSGNNARTITFWFKPSSSDTTANGVFSYGNDIGQGTYVFAWATSGQIGLHLQTCQVNGPTYGSNLNWQFYTAVFNSGTNVVTFYLNGGNRLNYTAPCTINTNGGTVAQIGDGGFGYYNGSIADVQIYNTSLDNRTVNSLYKEGIGGAPIDIRHIVGWWPLNGNANDYSGNNNQGTATNVIWNANWQSRYTAPTT